MRAGYTRMIIMLDKIEAYRQAVFRMLECVSPESTHAQFHDAVNNVILKRKALGDVDINKLGINWNKYEGETYDR